MCTFVWMKMCTYVQGKSGPELELSIRDAQGTSFKKALTFRCWPCICLTPGVSASLNIGLGCFTISLQSQPWDIHTCLQMGHYWRWISQGRAHNLVLKSLNQRSVSQLVQLLSRVQRFATPWIAARQASLSITNSRSSLRLMSNELVMPSSHLILCRPLLLLPPVPSSISLFQWVNSSHEVAKVLEFQISLNSGESLWSSNTMVQASQVALVNKESTCQCRRGKRCGFDLWVRKIPWKKAWQPTPVFLPGESPWIEEPGGYSP